MPNYTGMTSWLRPEEEDQYAALGIPSPMMPQGQQEFGGGVNQPLPVAAVQPVMPVAPPMQLTPEQLAAQSQQMAPPQAPQRWLPSPEQAPYIDAPAPQQAGPQYLPPTQAPQLPQVQMGPTQAEMQAPMDAPPQQPRASEDPAERSRQLNFLRDQLTNSPRLPNGAPNLLSDAALQTNIQIVNDLVQEGKIKPKVGFERAREYAEQREKQLNATLEFHKTVGEIEAKGQQNREADMKFRLAKDEYQTEVAGPVWDKVKKGDMAAAREFLAQANAAAIPGMALDIDLTTTDGLKRLEYAAATGITAKRKIAKSIIAAEDRQLKVGKEQADIDEKNRKGTEIGTSGLPDGFFRASPSNPQIFKIGADGKSIPVSTDEVMAAASRKARAGATNISTTVMGAGQKKFSENLGEQDAKGFVASEEGARAATQTYNSAIQLRELTKDPSKIVSGPGSPLIRTYKRMFGGNTDQEVLQNTALANQTSARMELESAQSNKGQGAWTDSERGILRKAAAGNLDYNNAGEVNALSGALAKGSQLKIKAHNELVKQRDEQYPGQGVGKRTIAVPPDLPLRAEEKSTDVNKKWGAYGR